jgi:hypothetical protein
MPNHPYLKMLQALGDASEILGKMSFYADSRTEQCDQDPSRVHDHDACKEYRTWARLIREMQRNVNTFIFNAALDNRRANREGEERHGG